MDRSDLTSRFRKWKAERGERHSSEPSPDAPEGTPWRHRNPQAFRRLLVASGVGLVVLAGVLVVLLRPFDSTPDKVQAALVQSRVAVLETTVELREATKLRQIREAGRRAETRIPTIDSSIRAVQATNDPHYVRPSVILLESEKRYLEAVAATQDLSDRKLRRWKKLRTNATVEKKKIGALRPFIVALGVGETSKIMPTTVQLEAPLAYLDTTITAAGKKIFPWLKRLYIAKARKRMELQALDEYVSSIGSADTEYTAMRKDTQEWSDSVAANGSSYYDAYSYLYEARQKRVALRDALNSAQRPGEAEDEHQALIDILDQSISLIEDAGYGVSDEQTGYEKDYRDSEGWQRFQSGSDQITGDWPASVQELKNAVAAAKKRVQGRAMPKRPNV